MKTKSEHKRINNPQSGNVLIYVLIAIALFAALSFTFARRNTGETTAQVDSAKAQAFALRLIAYSAQATWAIDQITMSGTKITDLDFTLPSDENFNSDPTLPKLYHPAGGGLSPYLLPAEITTKNLTPPAGVYIGRFNNTEWTPSTAEDVLLTFYGISKIICESLNAKITGNTDIPPVTGDLYEFFIDPEFHSNKRNLDVSDCPACEDKMSLCVRDESNQTFAYYTIIAPR